MYDVIVCGGGSAGFAAAVAAARKNVKTLLIESGGCLGGIWTQGCVGYLMDRKDKTGILNELSSILGREENDYRNYMFDTEQMKYTLEKICFEAGVQLLYHTRITGVERESNEIKGVYIESKSGRELIEGKIFIDCTGDGDVSNYAGCEYEVGQDGFCQPMSFNCIVSGIKIQEVKDFIFNYQLYCEDAKENFRKELLKAGVSPSYIKPTLGYIKDDLFGFAINHQYDVKGICASDVTKATLEGRKEVFEAVEALKTLNKRWEHLKVVQSPSYIAVREGRRIKGLYTITKEDIAQGKCHEDGVCKVNFCVDIHNKDGYTGAGIRTKPYDIPLRALIAKGINNLMMAGRCISGDFYAHASYRVSGNTVRMGEVAGIVSAVAGKSNVFPKDIDFSDMKGYL